MKPFVKPFEYDETMSYRERAEADLVFVMREYKNWWQPLATAAIWSLLAIARALEQKAKP